MWFHLYEGPPLHSHLTQISNENIDQNSSNNNDESRLVYVQNAQKIHT